MNHDRWTTLCLRTAGTIALFVGGCELGPQPSGEAEQTLEVSDAGVEDDGSLSDKASASTCSPPRKITWTYRSGDQLPLGQSRPGADVTLFVDFDGGSYSGVSSGRVASSYDSSRRAAIERAVEQTAGNYARWSINVTTDKRVFDSAGKRARIFITGSGTSGKASTSGISSSSSYTGYVGGGSIFNPGSAEKCAYVLTHEFGHNFGLRGTEEDYAVTHPNATQGAFMGGRNSKFTGYSWIALDSKDGYQDPAQYFKRYAREITGGGDTPTGGCHTVPANDSNYCTSSCACNVGEGDCDSNSQCASGLICQEQGSVDRCVKPSTGSSCNKSAVFRDNEGTGYRECEGDCDSDSDCVSGLRCIQLDTGDVVPGCSGRSTNNTDYCVVPACI